MTRTTDGETSAKPGGDRFADVVALLSDPATHRSLSSVPVGEVDVRETHGALVFLAGDVALKIKRPVRLSYLDFSTRARREAAIRRELEVNRENAPDIYRDVVAITEAADGTLALAGAGTPIEWALLMRRFPPGSLISEMAAVGNVPPGLGKALGEMAASMHRRLAVVDDRAAPSRLAGVVVSIAAHLDGVPQFAERGRRFATEVRVRLAAAMPLLENRVAAGRVRRCHGDLHLANLVWLYGQPIAFDAIEFDEALATIDVLYDIAFTLMDLERFGLAGEANAMLNRWLWRSRLAVDLDGLALLPLLLSLRAGVRAMVTLDRAGQIEDAAARQTAHDEASAYLDRALAYLTPPPPTLIAVGGLSGTGKSTLAAALAPALSAAPGAVHLRSDLERKALFGADELDRLGAEAYDQPATHATYLRLTARAEQGLAAGQAVIVDAVFAREDERRAIAGVAKKARVPFLGLWLAAPDDVLKQRVADRRGDASDATVAVVAAQLGRDVGEIDWHVIEAGGDAATTLAEARRLVRIHLAEHLRAIDQLR